MDRFDRWLNDLGLGKFVTIFANNDVGFSDLPLLTDEDLKDLGIPVGPRRRIQKALAELNTPKSSAPSIGQPALASQGERRQVTVLFADLSEFTSLSGEIDAEELHGLLNRYFEAVDAIIQRYGGRIDKHIGDSVMAVFGAPVARTDDPERATRAACDIHSVMQEVGASVGRTMTVHIGIASGQVVASGTGSDLHSEYTVTGESVNLAARLGALAGSGETFISEGVHEAVSDAFKCAERGEMVVKGFRASVKVWAIEGRANSERRRPKGQIIGRQLELRQFSALREECSESGRGCSLLVRGDPGIGKTRLIEEFLEDAERHSFGTVRSLVLDFGTTIGDDTIGSLIRQLLRLRPSSDLGEREAALNRAIEVGVISSAAKVFAARLLGLPLLGTLAKLYDEMNDIARETGSCEVLAAFILAKASERPLLLIVEDIHWADRLTLAHLSYLARLIGETRILLVMTTRVAGATLRGDWSASMSGSPLTVMELQPLQTRDSRALVASRGHTDQRLIDMAVTRSCGNPLFLELLMRNMSDVAVGKMPETLQGLVLARIDQLQPADKAAIQAGSVAGQKLPLDLLRHLIPDLIYDCGTLVEHRLLKPEGDGYLFDHALIREGVYASLLGARRRALHLRAAEWFGNRDLTLRAEHLDRGEDLGAGQAYLDAARAEASHYRSERALGLIERGFELASSDDLRVPLLQLKGELLEALNRFEESVNACRAAATFARTEMERCSALLGQSLGLLRLDRHLEAEEVLRDAASIAGTLGLKEEQALIHRRRATIEFSRGNTQASFAESKAALEMAETCGLPFLKAEALSCMADAEAAAGRFLSAHGYYTRCIELCSLHGFRRFAIINAKMLGDNAFYRGEMSAARESFRQVVTDATDLRDIRSEVLARNMLIYLDCLAGRCDAAIEQARMVREQILRIDIRRFLMNNCCLTAMAQRIRGDRKGALAYLSEAEAVAGELSVVWAMPWVLGERALAFRPGLQRDKCLDDGMALLAAGHGGYYTFEFYRPAIEAALESFDWPRVERLCDDFSRTIGNEPIGLPNYVINRARAIMSSHCGDKDADRLNALIHQASAMGILVDLPAIAAALAC